jgi:hypothetical protein
VKTSPVKITALAISIVFVAVACGGNKTGPRATATSGPSLAPIETLTPANAPRPKASAAPTVKRPRDGKYVYSFSGQIVDTADPQATPRRVSGAQRTHTIKNNGDITKQTETSTISTATTITRTRWEPNRVIELSVVTKFQGSSSGCIFNPPIDVLHMPIRVETFPARQLKGSGSTCGGDYELTVNGPETVNDATGRSWATWKITIRTHAKSANTDATETRWFSPELGKEIRIEGVTQQDTSNGQRVRAESVNILKSYPTGT